MSETIKDINISKIMRMLPHRYPFLMIDRVLELEPGSHIEAIKNVTINEPFFQGHFPGAPVMPGVLLLEAMAQAGGVMVAHFEKDCTPENTLFMFTGMEKVRFRKPVVPGDQLLLRCVNFRKRFNIWKMDGLAMVDNAVVAEATLTAAVIKREEVSWS